MNAKDRILLRTFSISDLRVFTIRCVTAKNIPRFTKATTTIIPIFPERVLAFQIACSGIPMAKPFSTAGKIDLESLQALPISKPAHMVK